MKALLFDIAAKRELRTVKAAQHGDAPAFQRLYERYKNYIYSLCLRMSKDPALSEDLTQDVFLHVWKKLPSFKGQSLFRTWLYRVAVNMVLLHFRKHRIGTLSLDHETISADVESMENTSRVDADERISLHNSLAALSPGYRRVLMLHDVEGYQHQDISRLLGITSSASRSQLYKARIKLRLALRGEEHDAPKKYQPLTLRTA